MIIQPQQLLQVAMIATNKNTKIANLVTEVISKAETINIEKSNKSETYVEVRIIKIRIVLFRIEIYTWNPKLITYQ